MPVKKSKHTHKAMTCNNITVTRPQFILYDLCLKFVDSGQNEGYAQFQHGMCVTPTEAACVVGQHSAIVICEEMVDQKL